MAEIMASNNSRPNRPGKRSNKKSTRVDLTPMVDLGFLLITFFIFTTNLSQKKALDLNLTHDGPNTPVKRSGVLTILLGKNDNIFYYEGDLLPNGSNLVASSFSKIRNVIIKKKRSVSANDMFVIIKPSDGSNYKDMVDILDEMAINAVKGYALDEITEGESKFLRLDQMD
jgi:biopolymer transport protein ExbD